MMKRRQQSSRSTMTYMYAVAAGLIIGVMGVGAYILLVDGVSRKRNKRREAISILEGDIVRKRYEMKREIGSGGSCVVWEALDLESKKRVAVKVVSKSACTPHQRTYVYLHPSSMFLERLSYKPTHTPRSLIINEINIMERMTKSSGHPNVVNMLDKIETSEYYFIVMDLCDGGELFLRLSERGEGFPEAQAKDIARQLIEATIFMHGQGIMHRDMKPENVVFNSKNDDRHVKVIDWGLAKIFTEHRSKYHAVATTRVGTTGYTAPEVFSSAGGYGFSVDYFSIGVLIYVMLTCQNLEEAVHGSIGRKEMNKIIQKDLNHVSEDARNIIRHLLDANPEERISVFEKTAIGFKDDDDNTKKFRYATRMGHLLLHQPWFVR